ncbi:MAG: hypothetical protein E6J90_42755 [Deltaproteobacteria bacterium]|nr:MAG: hypothetical protein E6J91_37420 [Deltaproteobacteria bacterium]TMQ07659.1 MAG: hypothetical protein E6J90_42755 [Deltaproteobacteria bacterium]
MTRSGRRGVERAVQSVAIGLILAVGMAKAIAAPDWKAAETVVRDHLAAQKADVIDIQAMKDHTLGTAFWVRTNVGGKPVGHMVVVRGTAIHDTRSDATIGAILKADNFLAKHTISAQDLLYLIRELGTLPSALGNPIAGNPDTSLNPKLTFAKDHAAFVLHSVRDDGGRGAPPIPTDTFVRATMTIAKDYSLSWKLENIERPRR